ncbi:MAG: nodulation protein NfeD [Candidatus Methanomethylicota archaeon]|jgi:membrane-bound serine protease (ClpP class)|uniref:Nodulation protein NfeD n=1 Tax=Thermoproteota archaeon TaxID=2056631 RepID=A0A523BHR9_9CREN|nr:MAG: nodulation protein NfeD [Candidatus Verstraetearchaeota archaeon]TDA40476.1 MAG: nodulation protein NfeD [Candidatus Verstraetearchaeota archaeon]
MKKFLIFLFLIIFLNFYIISYSLPIAYYENKVLIFKITGTISIAHYEALLDAINIAQKENYNAIIILLSTPGGSLDATLKMITLIENSPIPIIGYVYPPSSTAWSAGTYLLMACHIAAMAPNTIIGSCQPISYSPFGSTPINDTKILNALISLMSTQAKAHGRNETIAIKFITENLNLNDEEALLYNVIEIRAKDVNDLLNKIDGKEVNTIYGEIKMNTKNSMIVEYSFRLRESILNVISDPTISSILFLIGIIALIYGFSTPGHGGEIIGAIALILALIGMGFDINIAALIMMLGGVFLFIYELMTPGFGIFGFSGIILLILGSLFITPFSPEKWAVPSEWYMTFTYTFLFIAVLISSLFIFILMKIIQVRRKKPIIGNMIGDIVTSISDAAPNEITFVIYRGEYWQAKCKNGIKKDKKYKIIGKDGPVLILEEINEV